MKKALTFLLLWTTSLCVQASQGAWGLFDYQRDQYQLAHNNIEVRSIASVTKLFTATTIIRSGVELDEAVKVQGRATGRFSRGTKVKRIDLMKAMLISSDNLAAETLANTYPGGFDKFIADTNEWVKGWGLVDTTIVDASGLLAGNQSTVNNLITLIHRIKQYPDILRISAEANEVLKVPKGKKTVTIHLRNTNPEVFTFDNIILSKTGTTNAAGRCVVMLVEKSGVLHGIVVLGQRNGKERSTLAKALLNVLPMSTVYAETSNILEMSFP
jgi:D-alanyl-D-alanine carboxypeptidase